MNQEKLNIMINITLITELIIKCLYFLTHNLKKFINAYIIIYKAKSIRRIYLNNVSIPVNDTMLFTKKA